MKPKTKVFKSVLTLSEPESDISFRCLIKVHSHGAIFSECYCVFLSNAMGYVDVNGTVHMVQLRWIFVCDVAHEWVPHPFCVIAMCMYLYIYKSQSRHVNNFTKLHVKEHSRIQKESHRERVFRKFNVKAAKIEKKFRFCFM